jgi:hypothetical protein
MPIEPIDPSKKPGGDGTEKYTPQEKRGPGKFDEALDRAKTDRLAEKEQIRKIGDALNRAGVPLGPRPETFPKTTAAFEEIARSDAERAERKAAKASGGGGGGVPKINRDITKNMKKGGSVSSASKRADGCAIRGKTRA